MHDATQRNDVQPFSPLHITSHRPIDTPDPAAGPHLGPHRVLTHISFRPNEELRGWGDPSFPAERDAHLRPASPVEDHDGGAHVEWEEPGMAVQRAYVWRHPLVARSFATFAPSASVVLYHVARIDFAHDRVCTAGEGARGRAVTVMDVLDLIQKKCVGVGVGIPRIPFPQTNADGLPLVVPLVAQLEPRAHGARRLGLPAGARGVPGPARVGAVHARGYVVPAHPQVDLVAVVSAVLIMYSYFIRCCRDWCADR